MNVLISGATGFIGKALCAELLRQGHQVIVKTRNLALLDENIQGINHLSELSEHQVIDVAINIAGEPIADKRWSDKQKAIIRSSRLSITQEFIDYFKRAKHRPSVFISGSAIGYYGIQQSSEKVNELSAGDLSFSSVLCHDWESVALQAEELGIRVCILRTGLVIGKSGGMLKKLLPLFKLGLGGKLGSGKQWMPWIHLNDMIGIVNFCIRNESISGAINSTAPAPVTNEVFTQLLAESLGRPAFFNVPGFMISLMAGEMGNELLLSGKRVCPDKLINSGYAFELDELPLALAEIMTKK